MLCSRCLSIWQSIRCLSNMKGLCVLFLFFLLSCFICFSSIKATATSICPLIRSILSLGILRIPMRNPPAPAVVDFSHHYSYSSSSSFYSHLGILYTPGLVWLRLLWRQSHKRNTTMDRDQFRTAAHTTVDDSKPSTQ